MSTTLRFQTEPTTGGRPKIFWEEQADNNRKKKKHGYMKKEQPHTLRNTKPKQEPPPPKERRTNAPTKKKAVPGAANAKSKVDTGIKKKEETKPDPNMVTLTQKEFDAILETIGKLALETEGLKDPKIDNEIKHATGEGEQASVDYIGDPSNLSNEPAQGHFEEPMALPETPSQTARQQQQGASRKNTTRKDYVEDTKAVPPRREADSKRVEPDYIPGLDQINNNSSDKPPISNEPPPKKLSKAEMKRLQWNREKAEQNELEQQRNDPRQTTRQNQPDKSVKTRTDDIQETQTKTAPLQKEAYSKTVEPDYIPGLDHINDHPSEKPPVSKEPPPKKLSKAEIKRLQWEKEKAEVNKLGQEAYDPWGRPGAGAPVKDRQGNIIADYNVRKGENVDHNAPVHGQQAWQSDNTNSGKNVPESTLFRQSLDDLTNKKLENAKFSSTAPIQTHSRSPRRDQVDGGHSSRAEPSAIRSSFAVGGAIPNEERFSDSKSQQKRAWLEELEKQREEQRLRKLEEKEKRKQEEAHDTWADRFATHKPQVMPDQATRQAPSVTVDDHSGTRALGSTHKAKYTVQEDRANSAPMADMDDQVTYLRGQNGFIDPGTKHELEEKRRKQQDHQNYIKQQIEDRERIKREEKEKRIREEMEEEAKLRRELDKQAGIVEKDQLKYRAKEENERLRLENMKAAMDEAKAAAEREKLENRLRKLQNAGHDISHLERTYEDNVDSPQKVLTNTETYQSSQAKGITPRVGAPSVAYTNRGVAHVEPNHIPGLSSRDVAHVEPTHIPGLDFSPRSSHFPQQDGYVENRVLTPTHQRSPREFGVQTDPSAFDRENTTNIEYTGPVKEPKKVRVKSAPKEPRATRKPQPPKDRSTRERSQSRDRAAAPPPPRDPSKERKAHWELEQKGPKKQKGTVKIAERPKWGAPKKKKAMTNSERDPYYEQRKIRIDAARKQRQLELLQLAADNSPRIPTTQTISSHNRSKSRGSSAERGRSQSPSASRRNQSRSPGDEPQALPPDSPMSTHRSRADTHRQYGQRVSRAQPSPGASRASKSPGVPGLKLRSDSPHQAITQRSSSPPIPAIKHKTQADYDHYNYNYSGGDESQRSHRPKYGDNNPLKAPVGDGEFVPFLRTNDVLDPAHAESPLPISREPTAVGKARKAYVHEQHPAEFGNAMQHYKDRRLKDMVSPAPAPANHHPDRWVNPDYKEENKDPLINPSVVTDNPTTRQGKILQQLSSLRRGLMQKQRELEVGLPGPEEDGADY